MTELSQLPNSKKRRKRIGRGPSSGMGKTSCRGQKGAGARSGYKRRHTYEGGGVRLFQRLPQRGFSRGRHQKKMDVINLSDIEKYFQDGDKVDHETLIQKGFIDKNSHGIKVLGKGSLTKKIAQFEVDAISASAKEKIEKVGIPLNIKS